MARQLTVTLSPSFLDEPVSVSRHGRKQDKLQEEPREWKKAEFGTPEFFEWLNTLPADVEERLGEGEEETLAVHGRNLYAMRYFDPNIGCSLSQVSLDLCKGK